MAAVEMDKVDKNRFRDVLPVALGGTGKQKALALIGDRLLDLKMYEEMYSSGEDREGWMTQKRSIAVSNENLAKHGGDVLVPVIVSHREYAQLSIHEKATLVEAYIGALYVQASFIITPSLHTLIMQVLRKLNTVVVSETSMSRRDSQFIALQDRKRAKSQLLEIFQKRGITNGSSFYTCRGVGPYGEINPPFVCTFAPPFDLISVCLPDPGPLQSDPCHTKKAAEENVSLKVLDFFHSREVIWCASNKTTALLCHDTGGPSDGPMYSTFHGNVREHDEVSLYPTDRSIPRPLSPPLPPPLQHGIDQPTTDTLSADRATPASPNHIEPTSNTRQQTLLTQVQTIHSVQQTEPNYPQASGHVKRPLSDCMNPSMCQTSYGDVSGVCGGKGGGHALVDVGDEFDRYDVLPQHVLAEEGTGGGMGEGELPNKKRPRREGEGGGGESLMNGIGCRSNGSSSVNCSDNQASHTNMLVTHDTPEEGEVAVADELDYLRRKRQVENRSAWGKLMASREANLLSEKNTRDYVVRYLQQQGNRSRLDAQRVYRRGGR